MAKFRKLARAAGRSIKRRYFKGKGFSKPKLSNMVRDLTYVKSVLNSEKKTVNYSTTSLQNVAQYNVSSPGLYISKIVPPITNGTTNSTRIGNSIRIHSMNFRGEFRQQDSTTGPIKLDVMFLYSPGRGYTIASLPDVPAPVTDYPVLQTIFNENQFANPDIIDYYSQRNPETFHDWRVIRHKTYYLAPDKNTGQIDIKPFRLGVKFKKPFKMKYDDSGNVVEGEIIMVVRANTGNTTSSTGAKIQWVNDVYFYDN